MIIIDKKIYTRRPEIDKCIEQRLDTFQIGKALNLPASSIMYYITSRNLYDWYSGIQNKKGRKI